MAEVAEQPHGATALAVVELVQMALPELVLMELVMQEVRVVTVTHLAKVAVAVALGVLALQGLVWDMVALV